MGLLITPNKTETVIVDAAGASVDNRSSIQAALDQVATAGGGTVQLAGGTHLIKRPLFIGSNTTLQGAGRGITIITKPATVKSLLAANVAAGASTATVSDSTGFEVGGPIHLSDTTNWEWNSTQGVITAINGNVITFTNDERLGRTGADAAYQTTRTGTATTSFPLIRNAVEGTTNIVVRDLTLNQSKNANDPAPTSLSVFGMTDFTIATIHWVETYFSLVENCDLLNASGDAYSDQAQDGTGITPAANLIKTTKNNFINNRVRNASRHGVHLGTCLNGGTISHNEITDCPTGYGYFYCAYVTGTTAIGNTLERCGMGFAGLDDRDYDNVISANWVKNTLAAGSALSSTTAPRLTITGNLFTNDDPTSYTARVSLGGPDCVFAGNIINMGPKTGNALTLSADADRNIVSNNKIMGTSGAGGTTGVEISGEDVVFSNNHISTFSKAASIRGANRLNAVGNTWTAITSTGWVFESTLSSDVRITNDSHSLAAPVTETLAPTRLVYNGTGTNGTADPAVSGNWNGITGRRYDGQLVRWNSGGGEKVSVYYTGVGWTALN